MISSPPKQLNLKKNKYAKFIINNNLGTVKHKSVNNNLISNNITNDKESFFNKKISHKSGFFSETALIKVEENTDKTKEELKISKFV